MKAFLPKLLAITIAFSTVSSVASANAQAFNTDAIGNIADKIGQIPSFGTPEQPILLSIGSGNGSSGAGANGSNSNDSNNVSSNSSTNSNSSDLQQNSNSSNQSSSQALEQIVFNPFENLTANDLRKTIANMSPSRLLEVVKNLPTSAIDALLTGIDIAGAEELWKKMKRSPGLALELIQKASGNALQAFLNWLDPEQKLEFLQNLSQEALDALMQKLPIQAIDSLLRSLSPEHRAKILNKLSPDVRMNVLNALPEDLRNEILQNTDHPVEVNLSRSSSLLGNNLENIDSTMRMALLKGMTTTEMDEMFSALPREEVASMLEILTPEELAEVFAKLSPAAAATVLRSVSSQQLGQMLHSLPLISVRQLINSLDPNTLSYIVSELSESDLRNLVAKLDNATLTALLQKLPLEQQAKLVAVLLENALISEESLQLLWNTLTVAEQLRLFTTLDTHSAWMLLQNLLDSQVSGLFTVMSATEIELVLRLFTEEQVKELLIRIDMPATIAILEAVHNSLLLERIVVIANSLQLKEKQLEYKKINAQWYVRVIVPNSVYQSTLDWTKDILVGTTEAVNFFTYSTSTEFVYYYIAVGRHIQLEPLYKTETGFWQR